MSFRLDDYMDPDVAYLTGLIIGRGTIAEIGGLRQLTISFSHSSLEVQGVSTTYELDTATRLGLVAIRERLQELLDTDIGTVSRAGGVDLVIRFMRNNMIWRNILLLTGGATSHAYYSVPAVFFSSELPRECKREFLRGYADVAGNIRHANRYVDGRHRVRLDVLNYPANWELPIQLCQILQDHLGIPVQLITWGHPNLGRGFREHQINIFADAFLPVGFFLEFKQRILEEFAASDRKQGGAQQSACCPGARVVGSRKPPDPDEDNEGKLDSRLLRRHFDAYWQICRALGCKRIPEADGRLALGEEIVEE